MTSAVYQPAPADEGEARRYERAEQLLAAHLDGSDRWTQGHLRRNGRAIFIIPGTPPRDPSRPRPAYYVDQRDCTCKDRAFRRAVSPACCHMLAVRLWYRQWRIGAVRLLGRTAPVEPDPADLALAGIEAG